MSPLDGYTPVSEQTQLLIIGNLHVLLQVTFISPFQCALWPSLAHTFVGRNAKMCLCSSPLYCISLFCWLTHDLTISSNNPYNQLSLSLLFFTVVNMGIKMLLLLFLLLICLVKYGDMNYEYGLWKIHSSLVTA